MRAEDSGHGLRTVEEARSVVENVIDGLRGPDLPDDPSPPPLRCLERAIEQAEKADREVSPSKREMSDKARGLQSEVAEESERIVRLVAAEGADLVRRLGVDKAAEQIASALNVESLEAMVNFLTVRFPPTFGKDDEAVKLEFDEASAEGSSDHCSEQSDPEPGPEGVQYAPYYRIC